MRRIGKKKTQARDRSELFANKTCIVQHSTAQSIEDHVLVSLLTEL